MRFSLALFFAHTLAVSALAVPTTLMFKRQQLAAQDGPSVSSGSSAVSNPNINNGFQIDSSVIVGGGGIDGSEAPEPAAQGGSNFANVVGASFTEVNSNSANKDNIVINASTTTVNGDSGDTTNGVGNNIGDTQHTSGGLARRDVVFNNGGHLPPHHVVAVEPVFAPFVVPPFSGEFVHFVGPAVGGVPYGFY